MASAALLAKKKAAFLVMLAGTVLASDDLFASQAAAAADPATTIQMALLAMVRDVIRREPNPTVALSAVMDGLDAWIASLPDSQSGVMRSVSTSPMFRQQVQQLIAALTTPWNRSLSALDPGPALAAIDVPVLALFGERDRQAVPADNISVLRTHWARNPDVTIRVLPGLNHFLQHAPTGAAAEFAQISETLAPEALDAVAEWIRERFSR